MTPYLFTGENLPSIIFELAEHLANLGFQGKIQIVGGAAICISVNPNRDATLDVDAKWKESQLVTGAIAEFTEKRDLPIGWLNQEYRKYSPPIHQGDWVPFFETKGVVVEVASREFLLAMKLFADRGSRDRQDTVVLLDQLGITHPDEAEEVLERYWPGEGLQRKTRAFLEAHFATPGE